MITPQNSSDAIALGKKNASDILARRKIALARRAQALAKLQKPVDLIAPAPAAAAQTAGNLLALGDSWFDYPLWDVIKKLEDDHGYTIQSTAHAGDPIEAMAYHGGQLDNFARALEKVTAQGAVPQAVLLSGGGDDIAGKEFGMLLNNAFSSISGWAPGIVDYLVNQRIALAYHAIITTVTTLCEASAGVASIPILVHGYDYPVPDGRGFLGGWLFLPGPWLQPGFQEKLFDDLPTNVTFMHQIIDQFNTMLANLAAQPEFSNVRYVDLRGTLPNTLADDDYKTWWGNELHPTELGFEKVADKFAARL